MDIKESRFRLAYVVIYDTIRAYNDTENSRSILPSVLEEEVSKFEGFLGFKLDDPDTKSLTHFMKCHCYQDLFKLSHCTHSHRVALKRKYGKEALENWKRIIEDLGVRLFLDPFTIIDTMEELSHTNIATCDIKKVGHNVNSHFKKIKEVLLKEVQGNE